LCKGNAERPLKGVQNVLGHLGLTLKEEKTRVVDAREEAFTLPGFTIQVRKSPRTGRNFPYIRPSRKALAHIKAECKNLACRRTLALPTEVVIQRLNEAVPGWAGYFYYGNCSKDFSALRNFLEERVRIYLRRKHQKKSRGYKAYSYTYLYQTLGLFKIPMKTPWTQTAKAVGGR